MHIIKYADDTVLLECLHDSQHSDIQEELTQFTAWCDTNHLTINELKTKEMLFSNLRHNPSPPPATVHYKEIERVCEYRYLGTILTSKLSFTLNTDCIVKKANKRLYIMRKLSALRVKPETIKLAYAAFIESILTFHLHIIYGHLSGDCKKRLKHVIKTAHRLCNYQLSATTLEELYNSRFRTKCLRLISSQDPPILLDKLPSGRGLLPKHRINLRRYCFRSFYTKFYNAFIKPHN